MSDQTTDKTADAGDDRTFREIATDILVGLARIEGMLDGFLLASGKRPGAPAETDRTE